MKMVKLSYCYGSEGFSLGLDISKYSKWLFGDFSMWRKYNIFSYSFDRELSESIWRF